MKANIDYTDPTKIVDNAIHLLNYPVWIFDEKTLKIIDANKKALEFCMYEHHEIIGLSITKLWHGKDIDDILDNIEIYSNNRCFSGNLKHTKKNGEIVDIRVRAERLFNPKTQWVVSLISKNGEYKHEG